MQASQINARISPELKTAGDRAFESIGWSTTLAVRKLWEYAGRNARDAEALRALVSLLDQDKGCRESDAPATAIAESGPSIYADALRAMGVPAKRESPDIPYDDLLEAAVFDKMDSRGTAS